MRVPVKKILFIGSKEAHEIFFKKAQQIGWFEFISVSGQKPHLFPKPMEDLKLAIKFIKKQPVKETQTQIERAKVRTAIERILELKTEIDHIHEEKRLLDAEIIKVHPLGEFDVQEIEALRRDTGKTFQFFFVRHERLKKDEIPSGLIFIKRELDLDYYLHISNERFIHPAFTEVFIRRALSDLYKDRTRLIQTVHEREKELREFTCYWHDLEQFFLEELSRLNLEFAKGDVDYYLDNGLFAIEAWVPENKTDEIKKLIKGLPIYVTEVAIETTEVAPTYLENKGVAKIGQDLIEIYDIPSTTDKDPSLWVLCSFAIFFGMIVSDAGYGFLLLLATLYFWHKFPKLKGVKLRMLKLATILSCTSIAWGILIASYFSIGFDPTSPIGKTSILYPLSHQKMRYHLNKQDKTYDEWVLEYPKIAEAKTPEQAINAGIAIKDDGKEYKFLNEIYDGLLLEISIIIGLIHLSFSFLRNSYRNWSGIGWIITMWGAFLYFPKIVEADSMAQYIRAFENVDVSKFGSQLLMIGMPLVLILALIQEKLKGLLVIMKVIEVFADTLSYLRIYALGLAGMIMAATFNNMGELVGGGVIGGLVIFFGHTINMSLAIMGGILHGLRLNFLEWYHHSFEGGGKRFNPLKLFIKDM
jgi:V/A-type H+-transporting ATPase subunit I